MRHRFLNSCSPGQGAVQGIDDEGHAKQSEHGGKLSVDGAKQRRKPHCGATRRKTMNEEALEIGGHLLSVDHRQAISGSQRLEHSQLPTSSPRPSDRPPPRSPRLAPHLILQQLKPEPFLLGFQEFHLGFHKSSRGLCEFFRITRVNLRIGQKSLELSLERVQLLYTCRERIQGKLFLKIEAALGRRFLLLLSSSCGFLIRLLRHRRSRAYPSAALLKHI